jgi:two-component sensor histidine kinase
LNKNPWMNMLLLAAESQQVIALRMLKLAAGGAAAGDEAQRMTSEKLTAMAEAGAKLMTGGSTDSVVSDYRRKVRANIKRLTK